MCFFYKKQVLWLYGLFDFHCLNWDGCDLPDCSDGFFIRGDQLFNYHFLTSRWVIWARLMTGRVNQKNHTNQ